MDEKREVSPEQFTKGMPEGEGAGPDAPETEDPRGGRPGAGGHGPTPDRPRSEMPESGGGRTRDEIPDPQGAAGLAGYVAGLGVGWVGARLKRLRRR